MAPLFDRRIWQRQLREGLIYWLYLPAAVIAGGKILDRLLGLAPFPPRPLLSVTASCLLLLGLGLIGRATRDLAVLGHGTPNPARPARKLVTTGSYRLCRHPMFLGYDLAGLGVVLLLRSPAMLLGTWPLLVGGQIFFLNREERLLVKRFKDRYRHYQQEVPMLFPFPRPRGGG